MVFFLAFVTIVSCGTTSAPVESGQNRIDGYPADSTNIEEAAVIDEPRGFDPASITEEQYASTREEVRRFIDGLNRIIRDGNYAAWRSSLTQEYIDEISSAENLARISETNIMKRRNIVLRTLNDYFTHVVVPARASERIQIDIIEIEFLSSNRVTAFTNRITNTGEEQREILYDLEEIDDAWKIIN